MPNTEWLIPDITTSQDLSLGELDYTTSIGRAFKLESIHIHFSVAVTENITITLNSAKGDNYDVVLRKRSLSAEQDFIFRPDGEANFQNGDEIDINITNVTLTGIAYISVKCQELLH